MSIQYGTAPGDFEPGDSVETHPATDAWVQGDRYGMVTKIGRKYVHVSMNVSGKIKQFLPENLGIAKKLAKKARK